MSTRYKSARLRDHACLGVPSRFERWVCIGVCTHEATEAHREGSLGTRLAEKSHGPLAVLEPEVSV